MAALSLVFDLIGRDVSASRAFGNVGNAAEKAGNQSSKASSLISSGMKMAGGALLGAGLIEGFKSLYEQAAESARIGRLTTQVIKSTGGAAGITAKQVGALATAISNKTGVDDETIQSGENLLLTFTNLRNEAGKGNDIFNQTTAIMTDMSVALGQDTKSSAIQLGKALNDPIKGVTALQKVGVSFTASQKEQIKTLVQSGNVLGAQKVILAELSKEFGGAAAAAATPLDKLKVSLGNLAENLGGYLMPIVDKAAKFLNDSLIPAFGNLSPVLGAAGGVIGTIAGAIGHLVSLFNDLPGPVKITLGALGAMAALKGPVAGALFAIKDAAETVYLKMLDVGSAGGAAKAGLKGLVSFLGGPLGLALAAIVGSFALMQSASNDNAAALAAGARVTERATAAQQTFKQALEATAGVMDDTTRRAAAKALQDEGLLSLAERLSISTSSMTDSILGNKDAYNDILPLLENYRTQLVLEATFNASRGDGPKKKLAALDAEIAAYKDLVVTQPDVVAGEKQIDAATGETTTKTQAATKALDEWIKKLQGIASGFVDPLNTYKDLLSQKQQAEQESAQATADATSSSKDSWKDYVKNVGVSLDELATQLEKQLTDQANWRTNIGKIAQWAGADVANYLAAMGKDGVSIVAKMADGTTAGAKRMAGDITKTIQTGSGDWAKGMDQGTQVMAAIGKAGAGATVHGIATQLGIGADTIRQIASQFGLKLAEGINPLLVGLGKPVITATKLRMGKDLWSGGYTGDGGKYEPKGVVHGGEFVFTKEQTSKAGLGNLQVYAKMLSGYASGGFVSADSVPHPLSTAPYRMPWSTSGQAAMGKEYDAARAWVGANAISSAPGAGGSVTRWLGTVLQVLARLGQSSSLAGGILKLIQAESGGNPRAINLTDSNARAGHPSQGLMQTIPSTFYAYAGPYGGRGITDPFANIYAGVNYALHRYGASMLAGGGRHSRGGAYVGYETGTNWVPHDGPAYLHKGEAVIPAKINAAMGSGGPVVVNVYDVDNKLIGSMKGAVNSRLEDLHRKKTYR